VNVKRHIGWASAVLAWLIVQACAGSGSISAPVAPRSAADSAELAELEALYTARADSARMDFTEADVTFMTRMIGHHAQALVMAGLAPSRAESDAVRRLASRSINAQNDEIHTMTFWLEERGQPVPSIQISGTALTLLGPEGPIDMSGMAGMLSPAEMRELESASGPAFDRLFLTYMIRHHSGAVEMVHELFATDGAALDGTVFRIASDIQVDQTTEIDRMELMLEALPASSR
jgi:uncharacterized protein (DUF305 family)